ncbi:hypothetical protein [Novispirillum itersonii]|uniref:Uncharacterized protein n=1 Tax=Novispirillum itersonii TaxID=189 RepID=A0A7X0DPI5_NOVIT|nr:hypothetical protein [Novispirillum itersonii]MBB6212404.1 hypothetical protein [Novispirillum itersonii]
MTFVLTEDDAMNDDFPIEQGLKMNVPSAAERQLQAGYPVYYHDDKFPDPNLLIREDPDGTKTLVRVHLGAAGGRFEDVRVL